MTACRIAAAISGGSSDREMAVLIRQAAAPAHGPHRVRGRADARVDDDRYAHPFGDAADALPVLDALP